MHFLAYAVILEGRKELRHDQTLPEVTDTLDLARMKTWSKTITFMSEGRQVVSHRVKALLIFQGFYDRDLKVAVLFVEIYLQGNGFQGEKFGLLLYHYDQKGWSACYFQNKV